MTHGIDLNLDLTCGLWKLCLWRERYQIEGMNIPQAIQGCPVLHDGAYPKHPKSLLNCHQFYRTIYFSWIKRFVDAIWWPLKMSSKCQWKMSTKWDFNPFLEPPEPKCARVNSHGRNVLSSKSEEKLSSSTPSRMYPKRCLSWIILKAAFISSVSRLDSAE